jgi:hypothetical protein
MGGYSRLLEAIAGLWVATRGYWRLLRLLRVYGWLFFFYGRLLEAIGGYCGSMGGYSRLLEAIAGMGVATRAGPQKGPENTFHRPKSGSLILSNVPQISHVRFPMSASKSRRQVLGSLPNEILTPRAEVSRTPRLLVPAQSESRASYVATEDDDASDGWRIHLKPSQVHRVLMTPVMMPVDFRRKKTDVRRFLYQRAHA